MYVKVFLLICLICVGPAAAEEVVRGELRRLSASGGRGQGLGDAEGGNSDFKAQKIQAALLNAHEVIGKAAEGKYKTKRATAVTSMMTNAAIDSSVSDDAMQTMADLSGRKLSHMPTDATLVSAAEAAREAINKAASTGRGAGRASATGADMFHVATNHITDFVIDHVPDMEDGGTRKLMSRPEGTDQIAALQNTAEAIMSLGPASTKLGAINAGAASGGKGMHFIDQMTDTITHRMQTAKPGAPRRMLSL